ncbi:UDP-glucose/GDP-mannose dehydrogenase family protein [Bacillus sp. V5-8f]|uniref:UDP-glucose dehydrogenase family protein n=1 Tax=Bacillus sp. V5-8f TaxID=2053044 RepID=UPI000C770715|nr:UDP-glucose/GDP-mannose dehydrogenase family protein [Bacillus sp. V5-8f]PLT32283.1 UDP-glucose/GDP-mannose dehydrogenase family protein [Bacillus sp. V5-8f]
MEICVIGAGYVGLTSAAVLADLGHSLYCIDTDEEKIKQLKQGKMPIFEPGLSELIRKNERNLIFSSSIAEHIKTASVIFIAVGTPSLPDGRTDLSYVFSVVDDLAKAIDSYKTIITKSTVPPGTNEIIVNKLIDKGLSQELFHVVSNPEFLREGSAIYDMTHPDKIVVGKMEEDDQSLPILKNIYQKIKSPYIVTSLTGAEMIKYASNAFLATKISFINEIARICDKQGVNIEDIAKGIGTDPRIGPHFLSAGIGYGGSCFPKDVRALEHSALDKHVTPLILQAVQSVNGTQIDLYIEKLSVLFGDLTGKNISVLGFSFKPNTDDTRYSPAVSLIQRLGEMGCNVNAYDPKAHLPIDARQTAIQHAQVEKAIMEADCVVIATDWDDFKQLDWKQVKSLMRGDCIVDARNCVDPGSVRQEGLKYIGVARP